MRCGQMTDSMSAFLKSEGTRVISEGFSLSDEKLRKWQKDLIPEAKTEVEGKDYSFGFQLLKTYYKESIF